MKLTAINGVFREKDRLFTLNPGHLKGVRVYGEKLVDINGLQYRSWNPYRSKLAAAYLKSLNVTVAEDSHLLYLGASTGTTVSHLADIVTRGMIYAVENSAVAATQLLSLCEQRKNIIPLISDAFHPETYAMFLPQIDIIYQDISQRNQAEIFLLNIHRFLKPGGKGLLMVKSRSINVSLKPAEAYKLVIARLKEEGLTILDKIDLNPFERDHAALLVSKK